MQNRLQEHPLSEIARPYSSDPVSGICLAHRGRLENDIRVDWIEVRRPIDIGFHFETNFARRFLRRRFSAFSSATSLMN